jgi:uncharacterized protein
VSAFSVKSLSVPVGKLLVGCIRAYQVFVSPALPRRCKYYPSCSQYAVDALRHFGVSRGLVLALWRLLRCNPWSYGGYDPVERQTVFGRDAARVGHSACCLDHHGHAGGRAV